MRALEIVNGILYRGVIQITQAPWKNALQNKKCKGGFQQREKNVLCALKTEAGIGKAPKWNANKFVQESKKQLVAHLKQNLPLCLLNVLSQCLDASRNLLSASFFVRLVGEIFASVGVLVTDDDRSISTILSADKRLRGLSALLNRIGVYMAAKDECSLKSLLGFVVGRKKTKKMLSLLPESVTKPKDMIQLLFENISFGRHDAVVKNLCKYHEITFNWSLQKNKELEDVISGLFQRVTANECGDSSLVSQFKEALLKKEAEILRLQEEVNQLSHINSIETHSQVPETESSSGEESNASMPTNIYDYNSYEPAKQARQGDDCIELCPPFHQTPMPNSSYNATQYHRHYLSQTYYQQSFSPY